MSRYRYTSKDKKNKKNYYHLTTNNIPAGTSLRIPVSTEDAEGL